MAQQNAARGIEQKIFGPPADAQYFCESQAWDDLRRDWCSQISAK
jgi:hypothetical protein